MNGRDPAAEVREHGDALGAGTEGPHHHAVAIRVDPEQRMGIRVRQIEQPLDLLIDVGQGGGAPHPASSRSAAGILAHSGRCPNSYRSS